MSVERASAWAEWMTQKFGERGAGILSGWGVFEVIQCDSGGSRLSAAFSKVLTELGHCI